MLREAAGVPVSDLPDFARPARNGNGSGQNGASKAAESAARAQEPAAAT